MPSKVYDIKMNNPSTIGPDELLTVRFLDLKESQLIIPGTTKLTFNISLAGTDVTRTLVKNLGRNVIRKLVVKLEGNEIISIDDYDILYSYYDCWKCTTERHAVFQGIVQADSQTENAIKHRINADDKSNDAKDQTVASIFENKFCIPLDFEFLNSTLPLYQYGLDNRLIYELIFADYVIKALNPDVIKALNPDATYTISNISLEFYMTEFLELKLYHSMIPVQASQWILIPRQKVVRACYSFLRKKEPPPNLIEIPKNFLTQR